MRGHMTLFEKIYYMPIFCAGPQDTGGLWHLKKGATKKNFYIPNDHFWEMHKEN